MEWIKVSDKTPTLDKCGKDFLCCIETPTTNRYKVLEWFNPLQDGEVAEFEEEKPLFLMDFHGYKETVIAYCHIDEY